MTLDQGTAPSSRSRRGSRLLVVGVSALVLVLALFGLKLHRENQRVQEWEHGGDTVRFSATVATASRDQEFKDALIRAGGDPQNFLSGANQGFVVTVTWDGPAQPSGGHFEFVLLDGRLHPPEPIPPTGGAHWSGAYDVLAEHYPWLTATEPQRFEGGPRDDEIGALDAKASKTGRAVLAFARVGGALPVTDPSNELILAVFLTDGERDADDQVRWAKQVPLAAAS